jgi:hypothetical protein
LDQQADLLAAVLTQHWQQWQQWQQEGRQHSHASTQDPAAAAAESWARLSTILLDWFTSSAVMHPNAKKVSSKA